MMPFFFLKLIPPRPTFPFDITDEERGIMSAHSESMKTLFADGKCLMYGPVFDPAGAYGMGVFEAAHKDDVAALMAQDPSITSGLSRLEISAMQIGGAQASRGV